jgi:DNA-binding transcriptional ArsR family regulator
MFELRMTAGDFTQLRFACSPLEEAIDSLYMLHTGQVQPLYRGWADFARQRLHTLDTTLLRAIVPPRRALLTPPLDPGGPVTIEHQLKLVANWPPELLRAELEFVWQGQSMPAAAREVIADGTAGAYRVALALAAYWDTVIAPHWDQMRAVIDAEIAYRAGQLVTGGISTVLNDLHPRLQLDQATIRIDKTGHPDYDLAGHGVLLVPQVFAGPHLMFDPDSLGLPVIGYAPRGLGRVWENNGASPPRDDALRALIGKARAAILRRTELPATTTDLARELRLSGATVSVHLATLKRCGMLTSWRSGRRVLYQRTALATSVLATTDTGPGQNVKIF